VREKGEKGVVSHGKEENRRGGKISPGYF